MIPARYIAAIALVLIAIAPALAITVTAEPVGGNLKTISLDGLKTYSYDASPEGRGIQRIGIDVPTGTTVNYVLTYGDASTVTGTLHYYNDGFFRQTSDISLGSETSSYSYTGFQEIGRFYVSGYGKNETSAGVWQSGFLVYGSTAGLSTITNDYVFYPITGDPVIYKFTMTSNNPVDVAIFTNPRNEVAQAASKSFLDVANEWVDYALSLATNIKNILISLAYWLKFFFIDNLGMTVALYLMGSLAIAARVSRGNPVRVLKQFFKDQKTLFEFIVTLYEKLVNIFGTFRGIFRI